MNGLVARMASVAAAGRALMSHRTRVAGTYVGRGNYTTESQSPEEAKTMPIEGSQSHFVPENDDNIMSSGFVKPGKGKDFDRGCAHDYAHVSNMSIWCCRPAWTYI